MSSAVSSTSSSSAASAQAAAASVTSQGIGSGLNIGAIVTALTSAYGAAQTNQLTTQKNTLTAEISAYGTFQSALSTLQAAVTPLLSTGALAGFTATVADKTIATASASPTATAGQYTLEVQNLATAASLSSNPVASASAAIGTGTLTVAVGSKSMALTIDSANNTLAGIASAINQASGNPGVSASVLTTTAGARLVISGTATGAANAITVTQSGGDGGLASLVYDPANGTTNMTQTQAPLDAAFKLNGYPATSASNVVGGAISGVTLNLIAPSATGVSTTLNIAPDTTAAQTSIGTFVTALNGVLTSIQSLTGFDPTTNTAGPLNGNATLQSFQNQLEHILGQVQSGNTGSIQSLSDLGITANPQGTYDSNTTTLGNALSANLSAVAGLLGGTNGLATRINNLIDGFTQVGGLLPTITQGLQTGLTNVAKQQVALTAQLATYSATLTAQYNAMDSAVAALKQTQTYLTAEFNQGNIQNNQTNSSLSSGTTSTSG
ncbi:MAG: flagellar filament capping protein FliD [Gammaproteobacteria bacterium]|nr:flagellar filament capping protein FliD [Gammaproteobacteria bacterium]MDE2348354.1 flagellar filament capping protein FliD [Gammaproteobacteria bacterium]